MINYPITCITNGSKYSWLMKAQELLRREQNIMGAWFGAGITETRYQKLRNGCQTAFPYYTGKLSDADWKNYKDDRFMKKAKLIGEGIGIYREACFTSTTYSPNLDDDIVVE